MATPTSNGPSGDRCCRRLPRAYSVFRRPERKALTSTVGTANPDSASAAATPVSLWLNSGVPATEVARRAGHGVAVLLKIYAHCIDGQADAANQRITDALGAAEPEPGPGDEEDGDSEKAS